MRPISFSKILIFQEKISAVEDVFIEDNFVYHLDGQDFKTSGKIKISGRAKGELDSYDFSENVDVDCLLSLAAIDCLGDLRLQFKDYMVYIDERIVRFNLRYELFGNGEKVLAFKEIGSEAVEEKVLKALNRSFEVPTEDEDRVEDSAKMIKDLISSGELDIIGAENLLPLLSAESEDLDPEEIVIPTPIDESAINPEIKVEVVQEVEPIATVEKKDQEVVPVAPATTIPEAKDKLFAEESYVIGFFFVKVDKDGESYESLAQRFKIDPEALREANKTKPLSRGQLVKIPK